MSLKERFRDLFKASSASPTVVLDGFADMSALSGLEFPALENSAYWCCVMTLCGQYASLPIHVFRKTGATRTELGDSNPVSALLRKRPCPYMTSSQWRFIMGFNYELKGKAMAIISRSSMGDPAALYPVSPNLMHPMWQDGHLFYTYMGAGRTGETFRAEDVLVITANPVGTTAVLDPVAYAQKDIDTARQAKKMMTSYYANSTTLGGIVHVPKNATPELMSQMREMLNKYTGSGNSHKTMVLRDDITYEAVTFKGEDKTGLETAIKLSLEEICRRFRVPPFIAGETSKVTYASSEVQGQNFLNYCLTPRLVLWEDAITSALCPDDDYVKFQINGLLRGDSAARSAFYHNGIMDGWLSINDVRRMEDLNAIGEEGDRHFFPMNYTTIDQMGTCMEPSDAPESVPPLPSEAMEEDVDRDGAISEERRRTFLDEAVKVSQTSRRRIETIMRRQIKAEGEILTDLFSSGITGESLATEFRAMAEVKASEMAEEYKTVYIDMMHSLSRSVAKAAGNKEKPDEAKMDAYAAKYAISSSYRHASSRASEVATRNIMTQEDLDGVRDWWMDGKARSESEEESKRGTNCFNVYLFAAYGFSYMHVVSSADCCEFCEKYEGRTVEVDGVIIQKGETGTDSAGNVIKVTKSYRHPPFHSGCGCMVAPGRAK